MIIGQHKINVPKQYTLIYIYIYTRTTVIKVTDLHGAPFNPWLQEIKFCGSHQLETPTSAHTWLSALPTFLTLNDAI